MTAATMQTEEALDLLTSQREVVLPRVNLLPPEVAERRSLRRLKVGLAGVVVVAIGAVAAVQVQAASGVSGAQAAVDAAQTRGATLQRQISKLSYVTATQKQYQAAQAALTAALGQEIRWSRYLNDLSITLPSNIWITNVVVAQGTPGSPNSSTASSAAATGTNAQASLGTVTITGKAFSLNDVATWLDTLQREHGYADPYLTSSQVTTIAGKNVLTFTSTVNVSSDALSHRYTSPAGK